MNYYFLTALFVFLFFQCSKAQNSKSIVAKDAQLVLLYDQCIFTEGPAADKKGNVFFTDQPNNRIMKWSVNGSVSVYMENSGRSNGLYFDRDGNLVACADENNQLWKINKEKQVTVLLSNLDDKRMNGPNDLWIDPKGGIYFTDPFYKRDYWQHHDQQLSKQNLYYLSPDRQQISVADSNLVKPNGLIGTSDGRKLYVADIGDSKTYSYTINSDGSLADRKLFVELGSDGMTLDKQGNVYLTGKGVTIYNSGGKLIEHIKVDQPWTANVTFGGKKRDKLFITAMNSVYILKMNVKGDN